MSVNDTSHPLSGRDPVVATTVVTRAPMASRERVVLPLDDTLLLSLEFSLPDPLFGLLIVRAADVATILAFSQLMVAFSNLC